MNKLPDAVAPPKSDSWLGYAPLLAGGFAIVLLLAYAWVFSTLSWTENPVSWGAFGDYIGGLLNPTIALFTLMLAVQVWRLQRSQLSETKQALNTQTAHFSAANHREQQSTNEKLFFSVLEKIEAATHTLNGKTRDYHVNNLAESIRAKQTTLDNELVNFSDAYSTLNREYLDRIFDTHLPEISIYLDLVKLALQIIEKRIDDKKIFVQLFCAQVGEKQLGLIALMSCSSKLQELHRLILLLELHEKLPTSKFAMHLSSGWHFQID